MFTKIRTVGWESNSGVPGGGMLQLVCMILFMLNRRHKNYSVSTNLDVHYSIPSLNYCNAHECIVGNDLSLPTLEEQQWPIGSPLDL